MLSHLPHTVYCLLFSQVWVSLPCLPKNVLFLVMKASKSGKPHPCALTLMMDEGVGKVRMSTKLELNAAQLQCQCGIFIPMTSDTVIRDLWFTTMIMHCSLTGSEAN